MQQVVFDDAEQGLGGGVIEVEAFGGARWPARRLTSEWLPWPSALPTSCSSNAR